MNFSILLSPSEDKAITDNIYKKNEYKLNFLESLWEGKKLYKYREKSLNQYIKHIENILKNSNKELLLDIYGAKNFNAKNEYELNIACKVSPLLKAINRYIGVAFNGIDYNTLSINSKQYIDNNVLIFSNLFGVIRAVDSIPFYKLKQNTKAHNVTLKDIYTPFIPLLEDFMKDKEYVIDLRAEIYTKLFIPKQKYFFFEFRKRNKTISHYSKLYRGKILRILANEAKNLSMPQCLDFLCSIQNDSIKFNKLQETKNKVLLIYEIY